jgi:hypothetical protein
MKRSAVVNLFKALYLKIYVSLYPIDKVIAKLSRQSPKTLLDADTADKNFLLASRVYKILSPKNHCLMTSLFVFWNIPSGAELFLGVSKDIKNFEAHSWIEYNSKIYTTAKDKTHEILYSYKK